MSKLLAEKERTIHSLRKRIAEQNAELKKIKAAAKAYIKLRDEVESNPTTNRYGLFEAFWNLQKAVGDE